MIYRLHAATRAAAFALAGPAWGHALSADNGAPKQEAQAQ